MPQWKEHIKNIIVIAKALLSMFKWFNYKILMGKYNMTNDVNESAFYMWRTLVSVAHADNIVTDEEIEFIASVMEDISFSEKQTDILKDDIMNAKDVGDMFKGIKDQQDRLRFFDLARDLVWIDGDFASEEQSVMIKLYKQNMHDTNIDDLIGNTSLELEDEAVHANNEKEDKKTGFRRIFASFRSNFLSTND